MSKMKTRRSAKLTEPTDGGGDGDTTMTSPTMSMSITVPLPSDFPIPQLQSILSLKSYDNLDAEDIISLYQVVLSQANDFEERTKEVEEARAELARKEVELDQVAHDSDSALNEARNEAENLQRELQSLRAERDSLASSRDTLQVQLSSLSVNQSHSSVEVETLRRRLEDAEREKRDLISVVDRIRQDSQRREEEVDKLRERLKETRSELSISQTSLADARSSEANLKFKLQTTEQELTLLRTENERFNNDLQHLQETSSKERKDRYSTQISLQSQLDSLTETHTQLRSSHSALQQSHTQQTHQLHQSLQKISDLKAVHAEEIERLKSEYSTQQRLLELMRADSEDAKKRVLAIEEEWKESKNDEERFEREVERERRRSDELERQLSEMRIVVEKFTSGEFSIDQSQGDISGSRGGTPGPGGRSAHLSGFLLSPTAGIASRFQKSGQSYTEVYSDNIKLGEELKREKTETRRLEEALSQILTEIEERAPLIAEQRREYERILRETNQLTSQLAEALQERDHHIKRAKVSEDREKQTKLENEVLQSQLSDLGAQIRGLLRDQAVQQDPSLFSVEMDDVAANKSGDLDLNDDSANAIITSHLLLFKSLPELQRQNQKLLKTARMLATKWESREEEFRVELSKEESAALEEAKMAVDQIADELEGQKRVNAALAKERDMYRAMCVRVGRGDESRRSSGGRDVDMEFAGAGARDGDGTDYRKLWEEQKDALENIKRELGYDTGTLKNDLATRQREVGQLGAKLAKANAQIELLNERIQIMKSSAEMQGREVDNLQKRNQQLQDISRRAEIEAHHSMEQLLEANSLSERLRNEAALLRAEQGLWKNVEARLTAENQSLARERANINELMKQYQTMQADLERSAENDKRRLEAQVQEQDNQLNDLRRQLSKEIDNSRHIALQKDNETTELRVRLDRLTTELSSSRETRIVAQTSQLHLESRISDLTKQLDMASEKLAVYERRPGATFSSGDQSLTGEQLLQAEVAELRASLKLAETDLIDSRKHVQRFQEISQASEDALASLNAAFDQYKLDTDRQLSEKTLELQYLQERFTSLEQQFLRATGEEQELRTQVESQRRAFEADKKLLEDTIADLSTVEERANSNRLGLRDELTQQAELAKTAHDKYERELMAHAETVKAMNQMKEKLLKVQADARDSQTAAETAQANLARSEASWQTQKEALDKEMADLNARNQDLVAQNEALHHHLEAISKKATTIHSHVSEASAQAPAAETNGLGGEALAELHSVLAYVRREKEIADLQLDLNKQENARLKSQIEHLVKNLEETRALLSQERERAASSVDTAAQHAQLLEKINQLNVLRESNTTLRAESEAQSRRAQKLEVQLQKLAAELDPIKEQARLSQAEVEARGEQIKMLEEDNLRWKNRTQQIIQKHERLDPEEMQNLKEELKVLQAQNTTLVAKGEDGVNQLAAQTARIEVLETSIRNHQASYQNLMAQTKQNFGQMNQKLAAGTKEIQELKAERDSLKQQVDSSIEGAGQSKNAEIQRLNQQVASLSALKAQLEASLASANAVQKALEEEKAQIASQLDVITSLTKERDALQAELKSRVEQGATGDGAAPASAGADVEKLMQELNEAKAREAEKDAKLAKFKADNVRMLADNKLIRARLEEMQKSLASASTGTPDVEELVKQRVDALTATQAQEHKAAIDAAVLEVTTKLRAELDQALRDSSQKLQQVQQKHLGEIRALETKLADKYAQDLKAAIENASVAPAASSPADLEAAVAARLAETEAARAATRQAEIDAELTARTEAIKKEYEDKLPAAINEAKDNVRTELALRERMTKTQLDKLKEQNRELLAKVTALETKAKENKAQVEASAKADAEASSAPTEDAPTGQSIPTGPASDRASTSAAGAAFANAVSAALPTRSGAAAGAAGRGRGRGRGAAPAAAPPAAATGPGEHSIRGAAKRTREETEQAAPEPAKRGRGAGPPHLLRNRLQPQDPPT